jgi:hypothetical protein
MPKKKSAPRRRARKTADPETMPAWFLQSIIGLSLLVAGGTISAVATYGLHLYRLEGEAATHWTDDDQRVFATEMAKAQTTVWEKIANTLTNVESDTQVIRSLTVPETRAEAKQTFEDVGSALAEPEP